MVAPQHPSPPLQASPQARRPKNPPGPRPKGHVTRPQRSSTCSWCSMSSAAAGSSTTWRGTWACRRWRSGAGARVEPAASQRSSWRPWAHSSPSASLRSRRRRSAGGSAGRSCPGASATGSAPSPTHQRDRRPPPRPRPGRWRGRPAPRRQSAVPEHLGDAGRDAGAPRPRRRASMSSRAARPSAPRSATCGR